MEARNTLIAVALAGAVAGSCVSGQPPDEQPPAASEEDCFSVGDEDNDGAADCADSDCSERFDCRGRLLSATGGIYRHRLASNGMTVSPPLGFQVGLGDLTGDGRIDLAFPRYGWTDDDELIHDVLLVPSVEWGAPDEVIEVPAAALRMTGSQSDVGLGPSTRSDCDLDGDGWDELVSVDSIALFSEPAAFEGASLRIVFGREDIGEAGEELDALVVPLGGLAGWAGTVTCLGDVDGDLRDDVIIEMSGDGGVRKILLDVDRLGDATELADATRRIWGLLADPVPGPDIDGDGLRDVLFVQQGPPLEWQGQVVQREGWVLPGQASLAVPTEGVTSTEDEERETIAVFLDFDAEGYPSSGDMGFADIDGDSSPELLIGFPRLPVPSEGPSTESALYFLDASSAAGLSVDTLFAATDIVARLVLPDTVEDPNPGSPTVGDIDGDGFPDLLLPLHDLPLAAGTEPTWTTHEAETWEALAVYFGDGTFAAFDRHWTEADVVVGSDAIGAGWLPTLQVVEDIDGTDRPGVLYWSGAIGDDPAAMDKGFGSAGFLPGDWLREGAGQ